MRAGAISNLWRCPYPVGPNSNSGSGSVPLAIVRMPFPAPRNTANTTAIGTPTRASSPTPTGGIRIARRAECSGCPRSQNQAQPMSSLLFEPRATQIFPPPASMCPRKMMCAMTRPQKRISWGGRFDGETLILSFSCVTCLKKVPRRELVAGAAADIRVWPTVRQR